MQRNTVSQTQHVRNCQRPAKAVAKVPTLHNLLQHEIPSQLLRQRSCTPKPVAGLLEYCAARQELLGFNESKTSRATHVCLRIAEQQFLFKKEGKGERSTMGSKIFRTINNFIPVSMRMYVRMYMISHNLSDKLTLQI